VALEHEDERQTLEAKREPRGAPDGRAVDGPGELSGESRKATLKRTVTEFSADNLTDWAAALTYYGVLALFPALIALVSIIGLVGSSATQPLLDNLGQVAPGPARDILTSAIKNLQANKGGAGLVFIVGLLLAVNSASSYISAFTRASNSIYEIEEGRPVWKLKPAQIATTLVLLLLLVVVAVAVTFTGPLARQAGKVIGVGDSAVLVWDIAKIPLILVIVTFMLGFLYWAAPNIKQPGFRFISPGGVVALVVFIVASLLFAFYVATFASYNKTYGSLGGIVVFLIWLWLTNVAILFGAELNSELQRSQQREAGRRAPLDEPFLEPRDTAKLERKATNDR
jgi:membrane protein